MIGTKRSRPSVRCLALACALSAIVSSVSVAAKRTPERGVQAGRAPTKPSKASATLQEVAADPAAVWTRFLANAELEPAFEQFDAMDAVGYDFNGVDADACRAHGEALRAAVEALPVSIGAHRAAMLCADAIGDEDWAKRESLALTALSRHALTGAGEGRFSRPVTVLSPRDAYALLALLGYEFRYEYYLDIRPERTLRMAIVAWDADAQVEHHLVFDFVDAASAIDHSDDYAGFPIKRNHIADAFIQGQRKSGEIVGDDIAAVRDAEERDTPAARMAALREGAQRGGIFSLEQWLQLCIRDKPAGCAEGWIDAVLPLAEKRQAAPMALLATAYARGIGVPRDEQAATALLDAADRRWFQRGASVAFAALQSRVGAASDDAFVLARLRQAADAGNADAALMLLARQWLKQPGGQLTPQQRQALSKPSVNGAGLGFAMLAIHDDAAGDAAAAAAAQRRAAEAGHAQMQFLLAQSLRERARTAPGTEAWRPWMVAAAQGGNVDAMRMLSAQARRAGEWRAATSWLLAAVAAGDVDATYDLSALYETGRPELKGDLDTAVGYYERMAAKPDASGAEARRRLARLSVDGRGMKRKPQRAIELLRQDAERGDAVSQAALGALLLVGADGLPVDAVAGVHWLERAVARGSNTARSDLALWLHDRRPSRAEDRRRVVTLLREADPKGEGLRDLLNNQAWLLCASAFDDVRDPAAGLAAATRLRREAGQDADADADPLDARELDTVAACQAANGDFAGAARLQQQAIALLTATPGARPDDDVGPRERLALYLAGKAWRDPLP